MQDFYIIAFVLFLKDTLRPLGPVAAVLFCILDNDEAVLITFYYSIIILDLPLIYKSTEYPKIFTCNVKLVNEMTATSQFSFNLLNNNCSISAHVSSVFLFEHWLHCRFSI